MSYNVLLDAGMVFQAYGVKRIPMAFYLDEAGLVRSSDTGFLPGEEKEIEEKIQSLLVDKPRRRADDGDPSPLVHGVDSLWAEGNSGPPLALRPGVVPVVTGDDDTSYPSVVVVATGSGQGRIVASSLSGLPDSRTIDQYENTKHFALNVVDWLDQGGKRRILVTEGHREWFVGDKSSSFQAELQRRGCSWIRWSGRLKADALSDVGVVIIGTAWDPFAADELDALDRFVNSGGGLLLLGLGWSWMQYHPDRTLDDFPMNAIGKQYGIRWIRGGITDPTNRHKGTPVFHTFYPHTVR
jgi:hypothetical protein